MTAPTSSLQIWATKPAGKVLRISLAVTGMAFATLVLMYASVVDSGSWLMVLLGVALAATAVRAALMPTTSRLAMLGTALVAIPLSLQLF